jgi:hypothetical protein
MGVTQPSQRRYIQYFNSVFMEDKYLNLQPICLKSVILDPMPIGQTYVLEIYDSVVDGNLIYRALHPPILPGTSNQVIHYDINIDVQGDLYFKLLRKKRKTRESLEKEFHICLNTMFIDTVTVELRKNEMDTIREKRYSDDLALTFSFGPPMAEASNPTSDPLIDRMIQQFRKDDVYKRRRQAGQLTLRSSFSRLSPPETELVLMVFFSIPAEAKSTADTKFIHPLLRTSGSHLSRIPSSPQLQSHSPAWTTVKIEQVSEMDASKFKASGSAASGWVSSRASGMMSPSVSRNNLLQQAAAAPSTSSAPTTPTSHAKAASAVPPGSPDMRQRSTNRNPPPPRARAMARPGSMQVAPGSLQLSETGDSFKHVEPTVYNRTTASQSSSSSTPDLSAAEAHARSASVGATSTTSSSPPASPSPTRSESPGLPEPVPDQPKSESVPVEVSGIAPLNPADNEFRSVLNALEAIGIAGASRVGTRNEDLAFLLGSGVEEDDMPPLPTGTFSFNSSNPPSLSNSLLDVSASDSAAGAPSEPSTPVSPKSIAAEATEAPAKQGPQPDPEPEATPTPAPTSTPAVPAFPSFPAFSFIPTNAFSQFIPKSAAPQVRKESSPVAQAPVGGESAAPSEMAATSDDGVSGLTDETQADGTVATEQSAEGTETDHQTEDDEHSQASQHTEDVQPTVDDDQNQESPVTLESDEPEGGQTAEADVEPAEVEQTEESEQPEEVEQPTEVEQSEEVDQQTAESELSEEVAQPVDSETQEDVSQPTEAEHPEEGEHTTETEQSEEVEHAEEMSIIEPVGEEETQVEHDVRPHEDDEIEESPSIEPVVSEEDTLLAQLDLLHEEVDAAAGLDVAAEDADPQL